MYLRLSLDPRVLLPLLMLGGLATSVALYEGSRSPLAVAETAWPQARTPRPGLPDSPNTETLPLLDPSASLQFGARPGGALRPLGPSTPSGSPLFSTSAAPSGPSRDQLVAPPLARPDEGACADGMVLVEGDYCPVLGHVCLKRLDGPVERCEKYASPPICEGQIQKKRFCIDRFEYPNLAGVRPVVMVNWSEAKSACEAEGKRLCTGSEWTLACEGTERVPYPYGYERDSTACNIDRPHPNVDDEALQNPREVSTEVARLDQRVSSGEMARCKSPYGVQDMTGNVDEWVLNEKHFGPAPEGGGVRPFISGLKGGYWGPVRNRCRATTTFHNEWFRYYQVGFRCCANTP
ncbi:MAG TPA: SUMF1/EgtB/PvdO family nonheme iron enzyme [Polyangiaceae bacterium]|nr:SUMF1/EgtB/PvdO family nonheme iron enzyme [Polyangiaceae bacterium]